MMIKFVGFYKKFGIFIIIFFYILNDFKINKKRIIVVEYLRYIIWVWDLFLLNRDIEKNI